MLLARLTEANGAPGQEGDVRDIIRAEVEPHVHEIKTDALGNLIAVKNPDAPGPRVMLAAHMDEVALMIVGIESNGFLKFRPIGGVDPRVLVAKSVLVGAKKVPGVIGSKPIHLQKPPERERAFTMQELLIDIGAKSKEEAEGLVKLGEIAYFTTKYEEFGNGKVKAKALDDRVGCALAIRLLQEEVSFPLIAAFTVQEEVGLRGAGVAAYQVKPDLAIVLEGTTASDVPGTDEHKHATTVGAGPCITVMDRVSIPHPPLVRELFSLAEEEGIKVQVRRNTAGGTDAGQIQLSEEGVKVATIAVPCRYIHSPASVMSKEDFEGAYKLVKSYLKRLQEREASK
ncbi:MAG: M42 family metallopeptidase [Bacillota bacterium]|jgi:putative aminopeptidase FrvX|nr:M42 family metallopeptidase [Bacillota bacterium]NLJ01942.1 M42 family metallopeptidase [Bacillota bacterium]